jgi:hypothetical protein
VGAFNLSLVVRWNLRAVTPQGSAALTRLSDHDSSLDGINCPAWIFSGVKPSDCLPEAFFSEAC